MVWYGKYDTDADDYSSSPPPTKRQFAPLPPQKVEPASFYGVLIACHDDYQHNLMQTPSGGHCTRCELHWKTLHTSVGVVIVGTGMVILGVGRARTDAVAGDTLGVGR